ncbi:ComEC/Rec2 family competence protein [Clostridium botulinum]|uniref:ComEC/Rec2 family competence protein n=1 Tax=Clostridium botulinum TaxID=1491 RepID=A0A6B4JLT6_CLOBO|nr:ComEC/Rec2 family competence protein [Clostridium botulinum]EES49127.1 putative competence protein [Clostridium botulinum E1 str. 'BoNT E Beluga']MBY6761383.1 ComEC/Rec2 family competence protein [Clostridium botulinum]MBY6920285.1 ComEC/Rec2 family competence protein [Clostridium botulinum]MCR1131175.1 ComEC/Rec2 family competence protein [Clostridium botulinum]NFG25433.1 ComEC/Rec2 family competence protein [Clostridium botulinum]
MNTKRIEEVANPMVYIFITLILSSITFGLFSDFKKLAIFIVSFFFICVFYYCGISFTFAISLIFVMGLFMNFSYYNINFNADAQVRILKNNSYETIGYYNGKKIIIENFKDKLTQGDKFNVKGIFKNNPIKEKGIVGSLFINNIKKSDDDFISNLYHIKNKVYKMLEENLGKRKAGLISSIAFGYSECLDDEDKDYMKSFGIIHAISVSGLHVAIVYSVLRRFLGVKIGLIATIIYVLFTGSNYSSIRAFLMLSTLELSYLLKRNNNSISALSMSGIILLLMRPYAVFEVSFHLSYLATLGIILCNKKLNYKFYKLPKILRNTLSISLSAQIFTFPYLILVFKDFSINFILGNLFLMPFINLIVICGNILPITYVIPSLFDFCSYINLIILKWFDWTLDKLDYYSLPIISCNEYIAVFYMSILISLYFIKNNQYKFIYLPFLFIVVITIEMYSPLPKIQYYNEGAFLLTYKGDRLLITNKNNIDIKKLKDITFSKKVYRENGIINIDNKVKIKQYKNNCILKVDEKNYILKTNNKKVNSKDCDIINFSDNNINKIILFRGKVLF